MGVTTVALPAELPSTLEAPVNALWYRARFPLHAPRAESLRRAASLDALDRGGANDTLDALDLDIGSPATRGTPRFLGVYSPEGMLATLRAYGLLEALAAHGLTDVRVAFDLDDPFEHTLRLYDRDPSRRIGEMTASRRRVESLGPVRFEAGAEVISIAWLAIEDPDATATPALPGQHRPGLGLVRRVIDMALAGAAHMGFAAVLAVPAHYHLAWMYHPWFRGLDPRDEGALLAMRRATEGRSRLDASWAIARGELSRDGAPFTWNAPLLCAPIAPALRAWMTSWDYALAVASASAGTFALAPR